MTGEELVITWLKDGYPKAEFAVGVINMVLIAILVFWGGWQFRAWLREKISHQIGESQH